MRTVRHIPIQSGLVGVLVVGLIVLLAACGGSSSTTTTVGPVTTASPSTTASPNTTASTATSVGGASTTAYSPSPGSMEATIKANWEKFFDGTLPVSDKVGLLENGQQYMSQLDAQAASPLAKAATASVSSVTVTSSTAATVAYSILVSGQVALADQSGEAVLQDNVWKVSAQSFLALLALEQGSTTPST